MVKILLDRALLNLLPCAVCTVHTHRVIGSDIGMERAGGQLTFHLLILLYFLTCSLCPSYVSLDRASVSVTHIT